jgi:pimeloyl-ACP methyl ester carboxylesterase
MAHWRAGVFALFVLAVIPSPPISAETASPVRVEAVEIPGPKGLTLLGDYRVPGSPRPGAPAFLLVHGVLQTGKYLVVRPLAEILAQKGYHTLSITLSHGITRRTDPLTCDSLHIFAFDESFPEIQAWLQWLRVNGHPSVVLAGHSLGANQVLYYAVRAKDPYVRALVSVALVPSDRRHLIRLFEQTRGKSLDEVVNEAQRLAAAGRGEQFLTVPFFACSRARVSARAFLSYFGPSAPGRPAALLPAVRVPYLAVHGSVDQRAAALAPEIRALQRENRSFRWAEVQTADHFFREFLAEDLADVVASFMEGLP